MRIVRSVPRMQQLARALPKPVVLVPTMGALHQGHLALVDQAKKLAGRKGSTVATIFVNPTQFGPHEDYGKYPRPFERDCLLLRKKGCDLLFAPTPASMYGADASVTVSESGASVYSASDIARQEFPDLDLTVRGAISIARRCRLTTPTRRRKWR